MNFSNNKLKFENDPKLRPKNSHEDSPQKPEPYVISEELKKAVNLAIYLRRPLLLEGDAGCGKTRLASAVAYELGFPLYRWDIRSTTKAQDGLYEYDAILRLHDVQTQKVEKIPPVNQEETSENRNPADPKDYRTFGALGKAFKLEDCPAVVLIDEIDKADLDFPNDLLTVLDEPWEFKIKETGETVCATHKPIVIITSNKEKGNLPAPFLRRCLYHYVDFPNKSEQLQEIVEKHYQISQQAPPPSALVETAINRFLTVWNEGGLFKKPGTSEFLDWLKALHKFEPKPYSATQLKKDKLLPYPELLFKLQQDWKKYAQAS
ncbi:MoxR family ATPase [Aetokthonos hydrillicola Thurmond2011]|jgi:MoxR-like ATPase|uniref:MoxR family ATPase n=1 Tax=Aetokthonos hydrillicola Thurmond2011 TaxID=2712845 RepID=A0AAP5IET2_9CYAN|nr:MoxR family ATPase [Aetokthonos hydrillicola]MBO3459906.1 MoxR family ATPase [Aetokthonos hydrillicola CCALA 1050]MBW4584023.1 MoxR family ATPase [Aetokthonos hydrillicola CCALA 1050]MDR9898782.1 MoxR family ATPase [Aetokthonos hydrillicola Thurmond2011]